MNLQGKVALVTGASRGIGRAVALGLAQRGADVAVVYAGNTALAQQAVAEIQALGVRAAAWQCDVADHAATGVMAEAVLAEFGAVDILVNNAGIVRDNLLVAMDEADFDAVLGTNLKGAFNTTKHLYRHMMRRRSGRIINIGSVIGLMGNAGQANYAAAKSGLAGFSKSIAKELGSRGVTCNVIAPGFIQSDMTDAMPEKAREAVLGNIPAKRLGTPADVANLAAFLASDLAGYINGEVIRVDGGLAM